MTCGQCGDDCHAGYGALREIVARLIDGRLP